MSSIVLIRTGMARAISMLAASAILVLLASAGFAADDLTEWPISDLLGSVTNAEPAQPQAPKASPAGAAPNSEQGSEKEHGHETGPPPPPPAEPAAASAHSGSVEPQSRRAELREAAPAHSESVEPAKQQSAPAAKDKHNAEHGQPGAAGRPEAKNSPKPSDDEIEVLGGTVRTNGPTDLRKTEKATFYQLMLESARRQRELDDLPRAERTLIQILESRAPDELKRPSMLELALVMQDQKAYAKAQRLYSEYVRRFPKDGAVPDVLLRQAYLYRDMGVPELAMSKFFAVMSACLNLQVEEIEYYQKLVLRAQVEIAETYYSLGKFEEASDYLNKVLKLDNNDLNRSNVLFKLIRCYWNLKNFNGASANARLYLAKYPDTAETPEARYLLADSLKKMGQDREAVQEILLLLQKQQARSRTDPQQWLYWQQRAGNDIANQFYQQGDFLKALQVYQNLAAISDSPNWQLPVWYQIGLVFENLKQPPKASEMYQKILDRVKEAKPAAEPEPGDTLQTIIEMARWRKQFLEWELKAQAANKQLEPSLKAEESAGASAPGT